MTGATSTYTCWGCNRAETVPSLRGDEHEIQQAEMAVRGWQRRAFWPNNWDKGPWFCSSECAHESFNAKQVEEWWANKAERERQTEF